MLAKQAEGSQWDGSIWDDEMLATFGRDGQQDWTQVASFGARQWRFPLNLMLWWWWWSRQVDKFGHHFVVVGQQQRQQQQQQVSVCQPAPPSKWPQVLVASAAEEKNFASEKRSQKTDKKTRETFAVFDLFKQRWSATPIEMTTAMAPPTTNNNEKKLDRST